MSRFDDWSREYFSKKGINTEAGKISFSYEEDAGEIKKLCIVGDLSLRWLIRKDDVALLASLSLNDSSAVWLSMTEGEGDAAPVVELRKNDRSPPEYEHVVQKLEERARVVLGSIRVDLIEAYRKYAKGEL